MRRLVLALAGLVFLTGCDSLFGPDDRPPSELSRGAVPSTAVVGEAVDVRLTVRDKDGKTLKGVEVSWSASGGGSASPASSATDGNGIARTTWTLGTVAGEQTLVATAGELEATFSIDAEPAALAELVVTPDGGTLTSLGDSLELVAVGADVYGNPTSLAGLQWTSSAPGVAEVTAAGVVISRGEGAAEITATLDGTTAAVTVQVDQVVVGVGVEIWTSVLARSETVQLEAAAVDARGFAVDTALDVSWSTSNAAVASVSGSGLLEAVDVGSAVISAAAPPFSGELPVTVKAGPRPSITTIAPSVLAAGGTATITGTGFSDTPSLNAVTVAGVEATVTAASASQITITMPPSGSLPCGATAPQAVVVTVDELAAPADHPVAGAPQHSLAVGEAVTFGAGEVGCNEVVAPGSYVVTVFNTSTSPAASSAFQLQGLGGGAAASTLSLRSGFAPSLRLETARAGGGSVEPEVKAHLRHLDRNRALLEQLGPPARTSSGLPQLQVSAAPAEVGDLRTFRIADLDGSSYCSEYETVTARAVYAGEKAVIFEDTAAPLAGTLGAAWQELGDEFDTVMYPVLLEYFGDPLTYDAQLDADGRFNMLFSEVVNAFEAGVAGFVFSGDFFPRTQCASSNEGEIFYGRVPTDPGTGYDGFTADVWSWSIRSTVIHEVKHITSYATKIRDATGGQPNYEEQWLEESTARLSEEFYARALFGYGQSDNVSYQESIYCEIRVGANWPQCDPFPSIMVKHFGAVNDYLKAPESLSPIGKATESDWTFYGSGWLFVRWALDQSGADEATFVRALLDEDGVTGVANIEARTGRSFRDLLADFSLALATDDHPLGFAAADPAHTHPGWDTRDIFAGLHDDYAGGSLAERYDRPWPLRSHALPAGTFSASIPMLRGGSTSVFELTVPTGGTQLLRVLSASGGSASSLLGMALMRVQ